MNSTEAKSSTELFISPPWRWTREVKWAVVLLGILTAFRLWYCTYPEVIADEAYYWLWSNHLDASYYSKGPGIAWTIAFGTAVFGDNVFGIRWISVMLAAGTGWQLFRLARRLFDERTALVALCVTALVPLFALGSVLMTIDPISVFFWAWAANLFCDALVRDRARDWSLLGLAIGLGFLAKYVNALQFLGFLGFLVWSPEHRKHLRNPKVLFTLGVFLLCTTPVIWWNQHHGWITATHLKERGAVNHAFHISYKPFLDFITMQAVVISPLLFIGVLISLFATLFKTKTPGERYALCLLLPIFVFYAVLAVNNRGEANWTATGYIGALILLAVDWRQRVARAPAWKWAVGVALVLASIETAVLHETAPLHLSAKKDPLTRARGWSDFGKKVEDYRKQYQPQLLIGNRYQTAALIAWYLPGHPQTFVPNSEKIQNQFSFWPGYKVEPGTTALFVTDETDSLPTQLKSEFSTIEKVGEFWTEWRGRQLKQFYVYRCEAAGSDVASVSISPAEIQVIEVVLESEFGKSIEEKRRIIIGEEISLGATSLDELKNIEKPKEIPADLFSDFYEKNKQSTKFDAKSFSDARVTCISEMEIKRFFEGKGKSRPVGWDGFYKRYPGSVGIVMLSRVGFSKDKQWAILSFGVQSHYLAGHGRFYILHREYGMWMIEPIMVGSMWVS